MLMVELDILTIFSIRDLTVHTVTTTRLESLPRSAAQKLAGNRRPLIGPTMSRSLMTLSIISRAGTRRVGARVADFGRMIRIVTIVASVGPMIHKGISRTI